METLQSEIIHVFKHDSSIEPVGEQSLDGVAMSKLEYLEWLSDRYDSGENVLDMIIVSYQTAKVLWESAMNSGDFSNLSEGFYDSLAAIEILIQRDRVVDRYVSMFKHSPQPILALAN
ncbi:MAG TPA: hypothetical protein PKC86_01585 [Candidatus Saccharibacteria bacterium]|mgnify:CR=1 FL=1|nr:hypothetical protein [Candidatus Saccharibacteria bacterium]